MQEMRRVERTAYNEPVHFSMNVLDFTELKKIDIEGRGIDISNDGIGLDTDYPVERGCVLNFYNGIGNKIGFIKWVQKSGDSYKLGAQFV